MSGKEFEENEEDPNTYWEGKIDGEEDNKAEVCCEGGCMLHQLGFPAIISFAVMSLASAKNTLQYLLQKRIIKKPFALSFLFLFLDHFVISPSLCAH